MKKLLLGIFLVGLIIVVIAGFYAYKFIYSVNVNLGEGKSEVVFIPTGSVYDDVVDTLRKKKILINPDAFEIVADYKEYSNSVKAGKYRIKSGMSNNDLINMLASGRQEEVKVTFNNIRTKDQLAGKITRNIEADSAEFIELLNNEMIAAQFGFNTEEILIMFLPNTYNFYWNTSAMGVMERMATEYKKFWNEDRLAKADEIGLNQKEVSILASIVICETVKKDESPRIAGVYMNRMRIGMPLEADPTLIWALGDFTIKRVLNKDKEIESPYNTYKYTGLPPGPIYLAPVSYIDAVLDHEKHKYIFFCAKEDFSGYSNFATNYRDHLNNARKYQRALNRRGTYR
jgi:UPF0755 protein